MALLQYKDPRASVLYGSGNANFTTQQIKDFINTPGKTPDDVLNAALANNISVNQIQQAMGNNWNYTSDNVNKFLDSKGISRDTYTVDSGASTPKPTLPLPAAVSSTPVSYKPITIGQNETVAGQLDGILDPNSPLMTQAQRYGKEYANRRGLLNSSIGISAAEDSMIKNALPIASQDASTYFDAQKTNSIQDLNANMFNSDQSLRAGMFNTEVGRDLYLNEQNLNKDLEIANLDATTRNAIAALQARSTETGIMGDLSRTYMDLYAKVTADPNLSPDAKREALTNLFGQYQSSIGLMDTFQASAKNLASAFGTNSNVPQGATSNDFGSSGSPISGTVTQRDDGAKATTGADGSIGTWGSVVPKESGNGYKLTVLAGTRPTTYDSSDYQLQPSEVSNIRAFEAVTGVAIDMDDVVPEELIRELERLNHSNLDAGMFVPVPVPGSKRADNLMFSIYAAALPKYQ